MPEKPGFSPSENERREPKILGSYEQANYTHSKSNEDWVSSDGETRKKIAEFNQVGGSRFEITVDIPLGKKSPEDAGSLHRTFKFVIPEDLQEKLTNSRPHSKQVIHAEPGYVKTLNTRAVDGDFPLSPHDPELMASSIRAGDNEVVQPQDLRREVLLEMLKENKNDLRPKGVKFVYDQANGGRLIFSIDNTATPVSFQEAQKRIEFLLEQIEQEAKGGQQLSQAFAGISQRDLENAKKFGQNLITGYPKLKLLQQRDPGLKDRKSSFVNKTLYKKYTTLPADKAKALVSKFTPRQRMFAQKLLDSVDLIDTFEALALNLKPVKDGEFSFAEEQLNRAFINRLRAEVGENVKIPTKDDLDRQYQELSRREAPAKPEPSPREKLLQTIKDTLLQISFTDLEKKLSALSPEQQVAPYKALTKVLGFNPQEVIEHLEIFHIPANMESAEIYKTAARVAMEMAKEGHKVEQPGFYQYPFDILKRGTFKAEAGSKLDFVAQKRKQLGTNKEYVTVGLERGSNTDFRPIYFNLFLKDISGINSLPAARELQQKVGNIFYRRHEQGERLSFQPHTQVVGGSKLSPKFRLALGQASTEVSYKEVWEILDFRRRVEAELFKQDYLDNQKHGKEFWENSPDWKREGIKLFQRIITGSGFPSLNEQLIVRELEREEQGPAPVGVNRGVIKKPSDQNIIKPIPFIPQSELARIRSLSKNKPKNKRN